MKKCNSLPGIILLHTRQDAKSFARKAKESSKRVVLVTGCFDLLTKCHVRFLKRAREAGDILMVGIEDDTRVRAFKGPLRPWNTISQRVEVVQALRCVDFTFVISGSPKQPLKPFYTRLHKTIRADVLAVTEGDPHLEDRRAEIEAGGGELIIIGPFGDGSSTSLVRQILAEAESSDLVLASMQIRYQSGIGDDKKDVKLGKTGGKMKLLYCPKCSDILALRHFERSCVCGNVKGRYERDGLHAVVSEEAEVLGINNVSLALALENAALDTWDTVVEAWVILRSSDRVKWGGNEHGAADRHFG